MKPINTKGILNIMQDLIMEERAKGLIPGAKYMDFMDKRWADVDSLVEELKKRKEYIQLETSKDGGLYDTGYVACLKKLIKDMEINNEST